MSKNETTRSAIIKEALDLSSQVGLEGLTIGTLAKRVGMSKSGLYAHFKSKEELQNQVLDAAAESFIVHVLAPAFKQPRGIVRLRALFDLWLKWMNEEMSAGCPMIAASTELDDRPGTVRERLVGHLRDVFDTIARTARICVEEGHFREDLDVDQFVFEFWAILLAYHHHSRLMRHKDAPTRANQLFSRLVYCSETS